MVKLLIGWVLRKPMTIGFQEGILYVVYRTA